MAARAGVAGGVYHSRACDNVTVHHVGEADRAWIEGAAVDRTAGRDGSD